MSKYDVNFVLNSAEKIVIKLREPLGQIHCCYRTDMLFEHLQEKVLISNEPIFFDMKILSDLLQKALHNKLQLHESITQDIGYLCNEYYQDKEGFVEYNFSEESSGWIGYCYYLWEGCKKSIRYMAWIYNDKNGAIIFEITPCYPYLFCEPEEEPNYISYEKWIKNYKPYLIRTISQETAQQWLEQADNIVQQINSNIEKWEKEEEKSREK